MAEENKESYSENYAKKLLTPKYILIYLVVAVVVYGAIYYFFLRGAGGYNSGGASYSNSQNNNQYMTPTETPAPTQVMQTASPWTIDLAAQNGSGEAGTATLTDNGDGKTKVVVQISGEPAGADQPEHIHVGACPKVGAVKYPLANLVNGQSTSLIAVTIDQLKSMLPLAINVHESVRNIQNYVSCGDLK